MIAHQRLVEDYMRPGVQRLAELGNPFRKTDIADAPRTWKRDVDARRLRLEANAARMKEKYKAERKQARSAAQKTAWELRRQMRKDPIRRWDVLLAIWSTRPCMICGKLGPCGDREPEFDLAEIGYSS